MFWIFISRIPDVLSLIGLCTVLYWTVKAAMWAQRMLGRRKTST